MDYSKITLFSLIKTKMAYLSERQDVLAQNIANSDTPGYKPKDLKKMEFDKLVAAESQRLQVRATNPKHLQGMKASEADFRTEKQRYTYETTPVKNGVAIEEQMMKVAYNNMEYQTTTNLYKKITDMFKTAIGTR